MAAEGGRTGSTTDSGSTAPSGSSDCDDPLLRQIAGCDDDEHTPASVLPPLGSVLDGKYRLDRLLGRGGMGCVFAARHLTTGRSVAIKWMLRRGDLRQLRKRFVREARAAGRIQHANVIDVYDVVSTDDVTYLVLELLEGESLRARLSRDSLSCDEAVSVALAMLDGLAEAHRQGVIHRDLKPENVFLCSAPGGGIKLLDFGISLLSEVRPLPESNLTRTGYFVGTPVYTALERLREKQPFDHRVDVYSVGVILYEALTGTLPFSGKSPSELTYQLATGSPRPLRDLRSEVPAALEAVVLRALARDPSQRFADAQSFADALREALRRASRRKLPPVWARFALATLVLGALGAWVGDSMAGPQRDSSAVKQGVPRAAHAVVRATSLIRVPEEPLPAPPSAALVAAEPLPQLAKPAAPSSPAPRQRPERAVTRSPAPPPAPRKAAQSAPSEEQAAANATLTVVAFPYGNVWVDGKALGASPATVTLPPGRHTVSAGPDTAERHSVVNLAPGDSRQFVISWKKGSGGAASQSGNGLAPGDLHAAGGGVDADDDRVRPRPPAN